MLFLDPSILSCLTAVKGTGKKLVSLGSGSLQLRFSLHERMKSEDVCVKTA